jgi:tripartite-type tricarboxylate transporter receptor subunit TctC
VTIGGNEQQKMLAGGTMGWAARILLPAILAASACSAAVADDSSASFPNRPIRMIVPFPAGGPSDIVARVIGQKMSEDWGQPVVVENRPGANTIIGAQAAAKAAPDGYTLFMAIDSTLVMNQFLHKSLPYDPFDDFVPITLTAKTISVLTVSTGGPQTVKELIARAKAQPGRLNYGAGTITAQLMGHLFHKAAGLDIVYVPFKGEAWLRCGLRTSTISMLWVAKEMRCPNGVRNAGDAHDLVALAAHDRMSGTGELRQRAFDPLPEVLPSL